MGGDYYDREVGTTTSHTGYSDVSAKAVGTQHNLHTSLDPKRWEYEPLICTKESPIVFALDVTGSMGDWSKIIYDKMPMFYGQIMMHKYLNEPAISFCAVGDYTSDTAPLQVAEFGQGKEVDQLISKIYLEGQGGGGYTESYEFPAYFYSRRVKLENCQLPFFFITGDEAFYEEINPSFILKHMGCVEKTKIDSFILWKELMHKYNVFLIKKPYNNKENEKIIYNQWKKAIGEERVLSVHTPKACIDVILGAIAITSGNRSLEEYIKDMKERGQSNDRVDEVTKALNLYWNMFSKNKVKVINQEHAPISINEIRLKINELKKSLSSIEVDYLHSISLVSSKLGNQFPEDFICPITKECFINPVIAEDGNTYDEYAIKVWFNKGNITSPLDSKPIGSNLVPNLALKKMIKKLIDSNL